MSVSEVGSRRSSEIEQRLVALEAERDCRELLAWYGFYADHGFDAEWVGLFAADGVMDFNFYDDSAYFDENLRPVADDPTTVEFPVVHRRYVGSEELLDCITAPRHERIRGLCQHQVDGQPSIFRLIDLDTAVIVSDAIIYSRSVGNFAPEIQYQNHSLNRWTFRRADGQWRIAENIRKVMGTEGAAELLSGIQTQRIGPTEQAG